jgi:hypothetical protein
VTGPWIAAFVVLWLLVLALAFLHLGVLRRILPVLEAAERHGHGARFGLGGLPAGTPLPDFEVETEAGDPVHTRDLRNRQAVWLLASPGCEPCEALAAELREAGEPALGVPLLAISDVSETELTLGLPPGVTTLYQRQGAAADALRTDATPHALAVDARGVVVATTTPNTLDDLRALARRLTEEGDAPPQAPSGTAARA